jgi:hypothetical protein
MTDGQTEACEAQEQYIAEPYEGLIGTGDQFLWKPRYVGLLGWAILEVTDVEVRANGEQIWIGVVPTTGDHIDSGPYWIEESRFRESVQLDCRGKRVNEFEPHKYTTAAPQMMEERMADVPEAQEPQGVLTDDQTEANEAQEPRHSPKQLDALAELVEAEMRGDMEGMKAATEKGRRAKGILTDDLDAVKANIREQQENVAVSATIADDTQIVYPSGATRSRDVENIAWHLMPYVALRRIARRYGEGAKTHGKRNWEGGVPASDTFDHIQEHLYKWASGDRNDDHLAAAGWGICALMFYEENRPDVIDMPTPRKES